MDRKARDRADDLFSLVVRARAGRCAECGRPGQRNRDGLPVVGLECAHIISRRYSAVRVHPANAVALCHDCHRKFTARPFAWDNWCVRHLGLGPWEALIEKARDPLAKVDWAAEAMRLREELGRLKAVA